MTLDLSNDDLCKVCGERLNLPQLVIARGNPSSNLMIIGEAPGAVEEKFGKPFLGRSGKILDSLLEDAGFSQREQC